MNRSTRLSLAGFLATAVAFGPARMGYGLFLPEFRTAFGLSTEISGFIASAAFAAFLFALLLSGWLTARAGPRAPVVAGGIAACLGMAVVALAPNVAGLAFGVALAATSTGFCWAPFNVAAEREVPERLRGRVLSMVSTGTTVGIAAAGLLALAVQLTGSSWRLTWLAFAASGLAAAAVNAVVLRAPKAAGAARTSARDDTAPLRSLLRSEAMPLLAAALSFGLTSAVYLSFAVDTVARAGGLKGLAVDAAGPMLFVAFGTVGLIGVLTGDIESRVGMAHLIRIIFVSSFASLALLGLTPGNVPAVVVSAGLQGACVMTISAVFAFWSLRLFPNLPSISFTTVLLVYAGGNVAGPALAGLLAARTGLEATFLGAAGLSLLTALLLPRHVRRGKLRAT